MAQEQLGQILSVFAVVLGAAGNEGLAEFLEADRVDGIEGDPGVGFQEDDEISRRLSQARVAICLEQPAANLIVFLATYSWITLYPINPISLQQFRQPFVTSLAKDDD